MIDTGGDSADYENAACGLAVLGANGVFLRANATLCRWLGFAQTDLAKRRFADLLTVGGKIFHQTHWQPLLQMQGSVAEVQLELIACDGRHLPVLINAVERAAAGGEKLVHLAVFVAADRRKYERELLHARRRAEELLVLAEQLIGIVSHDLRNPLNAVLLGTRLLRAGGDATAVARTVERISSAARRADRLVSDLLDFTRARLGGGMKTNQQPIELHKLVADNLEEVRLAWPGRQLAHEACGEGPAYADPDRLQQVLSNLVNNALTYGDKARPVTVTSTIDPGGMELRVHNCGAAIPQHLQAHIFEPMTRGGEDLSRRSVGLGLYIVSEIAKSHGGSISVRSTEAEGTTFTLRVPSPA